MNHYYDVRDEKLIFRSTNFNRECIKAIDALIESAPIENVACGPGYLAHRLARLSEEADIAAPELTLENPAFIKERTACPPFSDNQFDTVVRTHTLEHSIDTKKSLAKTQRVNKRNLIIKVLCQKQYRHTFELHNHLFTYKYQPREPMKSKNKIKKINEHHLLVMDIT